MADVGDQGGVAMPKPEAHRTRNEAATRSTRLRLAPLFESFASLLRLALTAAVLLFVANHWSFFEVWLQAVTHAEFHGIKIDRKAADEKIDRLFADPTKGTAEFARAALTRAERVTPALSGAKVLWVDQHPTNNTLERGILEDMGIKVQLALSNEDADRLMDAFAREDGEGVDLVISNVVRPEGEPRPLRKCPATYFRSPDTTLANDGDLSGFNANLQLHPPGGFAMAETFAEKYPERFGDTQTPRTIFYTGASGGIAADACARIITNRADVLLQTVVSALEEFRWKKLVAQPKTLADNG
jgi:hypothetical protein